MALSIKSGGSYTNYVSFNAGSNSSRTIAAGRLATGRTSGAKALIIAAIYDNFDSGPLIKVSYLVISGTFSATEIVDSSEGSYYSHTSSAAFSYSTPAWIIQGSKSSGLKFYQEIGARLLEASNEDVLIKSQTLLAITMKPDQLKFLNMSSGKNKFGLKITFTDDGSTDPATASYSYPNNEITVLYDGGTTTQTSVVTALNALQFNFVHATVSYNENFFASVSAASGATVMATGGGSIVFNPGLSQMYIADHIIYGDPEQTAAISSASLDESVQLEIDYMQSSPNATYTTTLDWGEGSYGDDYDDISKSGSCIRLTDNSAAATIYPARYLVGPDSVHNIHGSVLSGATAASGTQEYVCMGTGNFQRFISSMSFAINRHTTQARMNWCYWNSGVLMPGSINTVWDGKNELRASNNYGIFLSGVVEGGTVRDMTFVLPSSTAPLAFAASGSVKFYDCTFPAGYLFRFSQFLARVDIGNYYSVTLAPVDRDANPILDAKVVCGSTVDNTILDTSDINPSGYSDSMDTLVHWTDGSIDADTNPIFYRLQAPGFQTHIATITTLAKVYEKLRLKRSPSAGRDAMGEEFL